MHFSHNKIEYFQFTEHCINFVLYLLCRDNDADPISVDNTIVQRILHAAENVAYCDNGRRYSSDLVDEDLSTPDHTTTATNSGSDAPSKKASGVVSYLAEQETAFSDGIDSPGYYPSSGVTAPTPSSSSSSSVVLTLVPADVRLEVGSDTAPPPERAQFPAESPDSPAEGESRVVYREHEADNSCVDVDDEETGERGTGDYYRSAATNV